MKTVLQWVTVFSLLLAAGTKSVSSFSEAGASSVDPITGLHGLIQTAMAVIIEITVALFLLSSVSDYKKGALLTTLAALYAVYHLLGMSFGQEYHCNCLGVSFVSKAIRSRVVGALIVAYFLTGLVFILSKPIHNKG